MKNKKPSKFSKERVLELLIEGRKIMEEREKSLETAKRPRSLTLAEQKELGLDTGTTMVVSFGNIRKKKQKRSKS